MQIHSALIQKHEEINDTFRMQFHLQGETDNAMVAWDELIVAEDDDPESEALFSVTTTDCSVGAFVLRGKFQFIRRVKNGRHDAFFSTRGHIFIA